MCIDMCMCVHVYVCMCVHVCVCVQICVYMGLGVLQSENLYIVALFMFLAERMDKQYKHSLHYPGLSSHHIECDMLRMLLRFAYTIYYISQNVP